MHCTIKQRALRPSRGLVPLEFLRLVTGLAVGANLVALGSAVPVVPLVGSTYWCLGPTCARGCSVHKVMQLALAAVAAIVVSEVHVAACLCPYSPIVVVPLAIARD